MTSHSDNAIFTPFDLVIAIDRDLDGRIISTASAIVIEQIDGQRVELVIASVTPVGDIGAHRLYAMKPERVYWRASDLIYVGSIFQIGVKELSGEIADLIAMMKTIEVF